MLTAIVPIAPCASGCQLPRAEMGIGKSSTAVTEKMFLLEGYWKTIVSCCGRGVEDSIIIFLSFHPFHSGGESSDSHRSWMHGRAGSCIGACCYFENAVCARVSRKWIGWVSRVVAAHARLRLASATGAFMTYISAFPKRVNRISPLACI